MKGKLWGRLTHGKKVRAEKESGPDFLPSEGFLQFEDANLVVVATRRTCGIILSKVFTGKLRGFKDSILRMPCRNQREMLEITFRLLPIEEIEGNGSSQ